LILLRWKLWTTLVDLGAVEGEKGTSRLTALGRHMSMIPVDLRLAKMLVLGAVFKCLDPSEQFHTTLDTR
jgi:ATP-dependent RNA helicase DHX57